MMRLFRSYFDRRGLDDFSYSPLKIGKYYGKRFREKVNEYGVEVLSGLGIISSVLLGYDTNFLSSINEISSETARYLHSVSSGLLVASIIGGGAHLINRQKKKEISRYKLKIETAKRKVIKLEAKIDQQDEVIKDLSDFIATENVEEYAEEAREALDELYQ